MIKLVYLLKRRADLTFAQFIDRYESGHAPIGERHLELAARYERRFLQPRSGSEATGESDFDVITEVWFDSSEAMEATMRRLADPAVRAEIVADEEQLFDRSATRTFVVADERSSVLPSHRASGGDACAPTR